MRANATTILLLLALSAPAAARIPAGPKGGAKAEPDPPCETLADRTPKLSTGGDVLLRGGVIHTVSHGVIEGGSVLVRGGRIAAVVGPDEPLEVPEGVLVVELEGRHVTPGIVDCHSHVAIAGGVNEGTDAVTAECRIADEIDPDDVSIFRALAGGCTTANLLHGSANPIGGQNVVVKMKYRRPPSELPVPGAPRGIKFALGENPKRSNFRSRSGPGRYPSTRMGVEAVIRRAFEEARRYQERWRRYREARARGEEALEPRRDLRLETLSGILSGDVRVHAHCYRADEILMLIRLAEEFGFRIATFQHVLEGYKVAPEIAAHGAGASTFSDWWAYKIEAYDAIPYNAALMDRAGVVVSLNSDSAELMRRLNVEAAKAVKYGGVDPERALAMVTLNPARQLGVEERVGSIDPGKDGDLVVWSGDPLDATSRCEWTFIEGEVYFRREGHPTVLDAPIVEPEEDLPEPREGWDPHPVARRVLDGALASRSFALVGGRVFTMEGPPSEDCTVVVEQGRITAVGPDVDPPEGVEVIDVSGLFVYPGMIDTGTQLGLTEIGSVAGTQDVREQGENQADLRTAVAFHAASAHIPVARANGITTAVVKPSGSLVAGQAALMSLDGWTWEEMRYVDPLALYVQTPGGRRPRGRRGGRGRSGAEAAGALEKKLLDWFEQARDLDRRVREAEKAGVPFDEDVDPRIAALVPYAKGELPVVFEADSADAIVKALDLARRLGVRPLISGGAEAWRVAGRLRAEGVGVLLGPVLSTPRRSYDPYDAPFGNAAVLERAGVPFAFQTRGSSNVRNLPYHAAMAVAYGLPREAALEALTIRAARLLGVDMDLGSIAPGKIADLVVTDGDLLDVRSHVVRLFVRGREVGLETRHTRLRDLYSRRIAPASGGR